MAERQKKSLIRKFATAAAKTVAVAALAYGAWFGAFYAGRGETLTKGETQAVEGIFGDQLDASMIRKHFRNQSSVTHVMGNTRGMVMPPFSHIDFFGPDAQSKDYSKEGIGKFGLFMHEVTHTWQGQNLKFSTKAFRRYDYDYMLRPTSQFRDFGTEQQAEIVENYAERWIHRDGIIEPRTAKDTLVMNVVERQFPRAKATRDSVWRANAPKANTLKT
ncbi:MAG: hypothetical protein ACAH80_06195 [Alphaproteobacteria bacterium]